MDRSRSQGYERLATVSFDLDKSTNDSGKLNQGETSDYGSTIQGKFPEDHRHKSYLALLFCCPYGLLAYRNSQRVMRKVQQGDIEGANESSDLVLLYYQRSCAFFVLCSIGLALFLGCVLLFVLMSLIVIYLG